MKRNGNGNGDHVGNIMTLSEVATYLGLHVMTVYKLTREGRVPAAKVGGQWRFKRDILDEWLNAQKWSRPLQRRARKPKPAHVSA